MVSLTLREPGWGKLSETTARFETYHASELLVAEFLATLKRQRIDIALATGPLSTIAWVVPTRSIRPEIDRVLEHGALRGADLWHLACALYLSPTPKSLPFLTRDSEQRGVAKRIGFPVP